VNLVKAVVTVAVEFDANKEITENVIESSVRTALYAGGIKVNDIVVERYITYANDATEKSVEKV
jgi:hypothetical protein